MSNFRKIYEALLHCRVVKFGIGLLCAFILLYLIIPRPDLYKQYSFSSAVYDRNGKLLQLSLSMDEKYRLFVPFEKIPPTAVQALLLYEDRGFYYHFGINPWSVLQASLQMLRGGRRRGASTISMQLARMIYHIDSAHILGKAMQMLRAMQIELFYSKKDILEAYFNLAPYGGNIEGIGAASQIYFKTQAEKLNLPQVMALTVIPQNPEKRLLLNKIGQQNNRQASQRLKEIWQHQYPLHAENEYLDLPLASGIYLPHHAPHFVRRVLRKNKGVITTTLDLDYQLAAEDILRRYLRMHRRDGVYNAAILVADASTMEVLSYIGSADFYNSVIQGQVDGIRAKRSPGSALKPFIYAKALDKGIIHPLTMLKDVPRNYGIYTPENFDHSFYGLIDATQALVYSRNIPAVDLLLKVGEKDFYDLLKSADVADLRPVEFYGLAMALGGVEVSMENLVSLYAMLYNAGYIEKLHLLPTEKRTAKRQISPEAAFLTLNMLAQNRATDLENAKAPYPVSWKTGTSYGFKDAWSIGVVGNYVVAVWVGNFDGTPNNAFVGREIAAPLFFRLVRFLAKQKNIPADLIADNSLNIRQIKICSDTGDIADAYCPQTTETYFIPGVTHIQVSNVARLIPIDVVSGLRACRHTPPTTQMQSYNFWPSDIVKAYATAGIEIRQPPVFKENCSYVDVFNQGRAPQVVMPMDGAQILLRSHKLEQEKIALQAIADADAQKLYWFMNNSLVGETATGDILETRPVIGKTQIKVVDDLGRSSTIQVNIKLAD